MSSISPPSLDHHYHSALPRKTAVPQKNAVTAVSLPRPAPNYPTAFHSACLPLRPSLSGSYLCSGLSYCRRRTIRPLSIVQLVFKTAVLLTQGCYLPALCRTKDMALISEVPEHYEATLEKCLQTFLLKVTSNHVQLNFLGS